MTKFSTQVYSRIFLKGHHLDLLKEIHYYLFIYCTYIDENELELRLARFENLMDLRPVLLSSVLLRQNPHNVHEWHKRVSLFEGRPVQVIKTYTEAVQTIDIEQAIGKPHTLWTAFAKFYEDNKQLAEVRGRDCCVFNYSDFTSYFLSLSFYMYLH